MNTKKTVGISAIALTVLMLTGCGQSYSSNDRAELSSLKRENKTLKKEITEIKQGSAVKNNDTEVPNPDTFNSLKFGNAISMIDQAGDEVVATVVSAQNITDTNEPLIGDLSHNYSNLHKFVIFNYKIQAKTDGVDPHNFDGGLLAFVDSEGVHGLASDNRDGARQGKLNKGETINMRIGVGFENTGNKVSLRMNDTTWTGAAQ